MTDGSLKLSTETFYDAFSLEGKANLRQDALVQFRLAEELTSDLTHSSCSASNAITRNNPAPPTRTAQQDEIESHKVIAPRGGGTR